MDTKDTLTSLERGSKLIKQFVKTLPASPGVYRMLDENGKILYVGKAKSLKKRVANYTQINKLPLRLKRMVAETKDMVFVTTHTEAEALLLESNLIKKLRPHYNILLKDDKSFPYILITDHDYPLVTKHRGSHKKNGTYYGPFASAGAVNRTIAILQKAFLLRNCSDNNFATRSRPCLQYHIKRCTAPCVDMVGKEEYSQQVEEAAQFLNGKSQEIQARLSKDMQQASADMNFEDAAMLRDRIKALSAIQAKQDINLKNLGDCDAIALFRDTETNKSCIQVFFFRSGQNFGNRAYFPRHSTDDTNENILSAFIAQFYENKPIPPTILTNYTLEDGSLLEEAFNSRKNVHRKTSIQTPTRGDRKRIIEFVTKNAQEALNREHLKQTSEKALLEKIAELFDMDEPPARIEVYDNSHISGTNMVGAMIVAGPEGFRKNAYRKFNINQANASDDYAMMREVMHRRFSRALREDKGPGTDDWPSLLLIDGGQGQLSSVLEVLDELGITDELTIVSIAKGPDRNAGREKFFMKGKKPFDLPIDDPALHYLQRLRDESHRFAIGSHRARRSRDISRSPLDEISGIGAKRKKALLHYFGSAREVANAGIIDLQKVSGISASMAEQIYAHFNNTE